MQTQEDPYLAHIAAEEYRATSATANAAQAYARLLHLAETQRSGQMRRVVLFLAATFNGQAYRFDPFELRAVDTEISDDMLQCLDALRWARVDLHRLVPEGDRRMRRVLQVWHLSDSGEDD